MSGVVELAEVCIEPAMPVKNEETGLWNHLNPSYDGQCPLCGYVFRRYMAGVCRCYSCKQRFRIVRGRPGKGAVVRGDYSLTEVQRSRLGRLTLRERDVLTLCEETGNRRTVAQRLHVTLERVRQIHVKALKKLASERLIIARPSALCSDDRIEELDFSVRTWNCLRKNDVRTIAQLETLTEEQLMDIRNFGKKSLVEVREKLAAWKKGQG